MVEPAEDEVWDKGAMTEGSPHAGTLLASGLYLLTHLI